MQKMNVDNNILSQYYKGILTQLNSEVQLINRIFNHSGIKGEGNETAIRNLIEKFIPKKYGVSSGVIIDKKGNQSRQCDIVIYDNYNYPELLSMSTSKLFPIDLVYAVIEIKTSLDIGKSKIAIENINSVLSLDYIKESYRTTPTEPVGKIGPETILFTDQMTTPPLGFVFSYQTETNSVETFHKWFSKKNNEETEYLPSRICSLDQGILSIRNGTGKELPLVFPLVENEEYQEMKDNEIVEINKHKFCIYKDSLYPFTKVGKEEVLVDQGKTLLNFILMLTKMIQNKSLHPNLDLMNHYLTKELKVKFTVNNGKLNVIE